MNEKILQIIAEEVGNNITFDDLSIILQNEQIKNYLDSEFNMKSIKRSDLNKITSNENVILLFEIYLTKKNINIIEDYNDFELFDNNDVNVDIFKQYINEIRKYPLLTPQEEKELFIKYSNGDMEAKQIIIKSNLRLVISIAKKYQNDNLNILDLIQEGNIGLMTAIDKFEYEKGYKLSTYATWWIRQTITRSIYNDSKSIRLPVHVFEDVVKIKRIKKKYEIENGKEISIEELSNISCMSISRVEEILEYSKNIVSADKPIGEKEHGEASTILDFLADDYNLEDDGMTKILKENIQEILNVLTPRERQIIELRFGINDGIIHTLEEVGEIFQVTRERIRQIESKSLLKLKKISYKKNLKDFLS